MSSTFSLDRIVFDRSVWTVFFPSIIKKADECPFNPYLIEKHNLENELSVSRFRGKGTEKTLLYEVGSPKPYLRIDMRLRQTRAMRVIFNFNRYFVQKFHLKHNIKMPVIHDDNFLPADTTITLEDYLRVYNDTLPRELEELYRSKFSMLWPHEYARLEQDDEKVVVKCCTLEVAREMRPLDVEDVRSEMIVKGSWMRSSGVPMHTWNSQSKTVTFGERPEKELEFLENDALLSADVEVWNWKEPYEHVRQGKLYQKSFDLARFEITLYNQQIDINMEGNPEEDLRFILDDYAEKCGIVWKMMDKTFDDMVIFIGKAFGIDEVVIKSLIQNNYQWSATLANRSTTQRLLRRGLIIPIGRGRYVANHLLRAIFIHYDLGKEKPIYIPRYL